MRGKHLLMDIKTNNQINKLEDIEPIMKSIIRIGNLNTLGVLKHQFEPIGATIIYLLSESHLSAHTYPEHNYIAIDLYCCNPDINFEPIIKEINNYFNVIN